MKTELSRMKAHAGFESYEDLLKLSLSYIEEPPASQYVWRDIIDAVNRVSMLVSERNAFELEEQQLARFVKYLLSPLMEKLKYIPQQDGCALF